MSCVTVPQRTHRQTLFYLTTAASYVPSASLTWQNPEEL